MLPIIEIDEIGIGFARCVVSKPLFASTIGCCVLQRGNLGDVAPVGEGVSERSLMFGQGYSVYFAMHENTAILLLAGGDRSIGPKDIENPKALWRDVQN